MNKKLLSLDRKNSIFPKVTKASTSGQRIDYNGGRGSERTAAPPRGGVLPYISHIGMCHPKGLGFCEVLVSENWA